MSNKKTAVASGLGAFTGTLFFSIVTAIIIYIMLRPVIKQLKGMTLDANNIIKSAKTNLPFLDPEKVKQYLQEENINYLP